MDLIDEDALARLGDMSKEAAAIRMRAAFQLTGIAEQQKMAAAAGVKKTTFNQMWKGFSYPNREVMRFLFRRHGIDFNFLMIGDLSFLRSDKRERMTSALRDATSAWDQERG